MMATCTQATYDAEKWKINPADFIHVFRVHEGATAPAPGAAGDGGLRQLLSGQAHAASASPDMERVPDTPPPQAQPVLDESARRPHRPCL